MVINNLLSLINLESISKVLISHKLILLDSSDNPIKMIMKKSGEEFKETKKPYMMKS